MNRLVALVLFSVLSLSAFGQVFSDRVVGEDNSEYIDSLKTVEYPYVFPILGQKVVNLGYDLPYSAGLSLNYFWQNSDIIIDNLMVGFNGGEQYDLDHIVRFTKTQSNSNSINIRPDFWLFPFLNIYGIIARSDLSTLVALDVYAPTSGGQEKLFDMETQVDFNAMSYGIGFTPTMGVGGGFLALDMNVTWNDIPELEKPAVGFVFGPRLGKQFKFKQPERALAVWVGGFRLKLNSGTAGSLRLDDVLNFDGQIEEKIEMGMEEVISRQQELDDWYNALPPPLQEINEPIYNAKSAVLSGTYAFLNNALEATDNIQNSTVQYSIDKRPKDKWNFLIGSQFQVNKRWMIRGEYGFLGSRTQFTGGLQYRFGL